MRDPEALIDNVATARGLCVPVQPHFPLGREFVAACLAARDAEHFTAGRPDLAHLSRADLEGMVADALRYIDDAKAAGGTWNYSGRPLPELVRELREAAEANANGRETRD